MKFIISIVILIFNLQYFAKADEIREFTIEGVGIGDSLIDHMSIEDYNIFQKAQYEYVHTFATIKIKVDNLNLYEQVRGYYKIKDKNKIIHAVEGTTRISNISECIKLMNEVTNEIDKEYLHLKSEKNVFNHWVDKSNKSKVHQIDYEFNSGDAIAVQCVDWSKEMEEENGWIDNFRVTLFDKDTLNFLRSLN